MPQKNSASSPPWVALFDLDGTLTWRDTLLPFLRGYLRRHPRRLAGLWRVLAALAAFAPDRDRGKLKARCIRAVMGGDARAAIDAWAESFVSEMRARQSFRPTALAVLEAHRAAGDHLVLLSASPDLYVPHIGRLLSFELTLCTEVKWNGDRLDGALTTPNRRGAEKLRCLERLRTQYRDLQIIAYGNSASDLEHLRAADRALLVNGDPEARRLAALFGIPASSWG